MKKPRQHKSRQDKAFDRMVAQCVANVRKRKTNKKLKQMEREEFYKNYSQIFKGTLGFTEPRENWADSTCVKKTVFDPVNLHHIDVDDINEKRKQVGIETTIEEGIAQALEESKRKAKQVAVICPKSSYQYIGTGDLKDMGKKSNQLIVSDKIVD